MKEIDVDRRQFESPDKKSNKKYNFFPKKIIDIFQKYYIVLAFLGMMVAGTIASPYFLTLNNFRNVSIQLSMNVIIALGMLFTVISGGIDLSVGSIVALGGCLVAGFTQEGYSPGLAILIVIGLMGLAGSVSGLLVSKAKIAPFIATLATMTIWRGVSYIYQTGSDRRIDGTKIVDLLTGRVGPIPVAVIIMVVVGVVSWYILNKTSFGRSVYAVGGNKEAARLAGINVDIALTSAYMISGIFAGLSGILLAARLSLGTALVGQGYELDAIASVVVGGASLSGGKGGVINTILGAFIIGFLNNILNLAGVAAYPQMIIKGVIIVAAVMLKKE